MTFDSKMTCDSIIVPSGESITETSTAPKNGCIPHRQGSRSTGGIVYNKKQKITAIYIFMTS